MNTNAKLNITSVIGVRDGIDQIFSLINEYLETYVQNTTETDSLKSCRSYVHQLNGLLEMLELSNVAVISNKMETLMDRLIGHQIDPEPNVLQALKQTTDSLLNFLYELIDGADENLTRLFPAYRNLMKAQGVDNVSESDLFCTKPATEPPLQQSIPNPEPIEIRTTAKQARTQYQAGLLQWLRNPAKHDGMQQMISAINLIEQFPGTTKQRSFWWVCTGFLESLLDEKTSIELPVRRICGKIEQEIRKLAENKPATTDNTLQEILYHIAQSELDNERIREIKEIYKLQKQPSPADEKTSALQLEQEKERDSTLTAMHQALKIINEDWRQFYSGEQADPSSLLKNIEKLKEHTANLKLSPLDKLVNVVGGSISFLRIKPAEINKEIAVEIATALLFIENTITDFDKLSPAFTEQSDALCKRLRMFTTGKQQEQDLPPIPVPDNIKYSTQEKKLVSQEISANLKQIEGVLDQFFSDPANPSDLKKLLPLFKQTSGMLMILNLNHANQLLNHCQKLSEKLLQPEFKIKPPDQVRLADGLSSLGFYIEALTYAHPENDKIIEAALALFSDEPIHGSITPEAMTSICPAPVEEPDIEEDGTENIDPELLATFLEESDGVLQEIEENLASCQIDSSGKSALTELRRGFHTLKGSGRMVELHEISQAAWEIEQVLNRWLSENKSATRPLIDLITLAHHQFRQWCDQLKTNGTAQIDINQLRLLIENVNNDSPILEIVDEPAAQNDTTDHSQQTVSSENIDNKPAADIILGNITITRDLFDAYTSEANQHFSALEDSLNNYAEYHNPSSNQLVTNAANNLSTCSQALGLTFIASLTASLEQWSAQLQKISGRPDETGLQCAQIIVERLGKILEKVKHQQLPDENDLQAANTLSHELMLLTDQEKQRAEVESSSLKSDNEPQQIMPTDWSSCQQTNDSHELQNEDYDTIDQLDPELALVFFDEARELIPEIGKKLRAWRILPQDDSIHKALQRTLHTLKGSARMSGAVQLGEMIHDMESGVEETTSDHIVSVSMIENLETRFDKISEHIERLQHATKTEKQVVTPEQIESEALSNALALTASQSDGGKPAKSQLSPEITDSVTKNIVLRVNEELIDRLLNESSEISIFRSKIESQLYYYKQSLLDLAESTDRLRKQLREIEIQAESQIMAQHTQSHDDNHSFDPLEFDRFTRFQELTRLMAESVDDVVTVQQYLREIHNAARESANQQALVSRQMQQALMQIRTVPFSNFTEHFHRIVRQTARDLNKKVSLTILNDKVAIDRSVLEKIKSPIEHLLRNAVAHGIEAPSARAAQGKPKSGKITIDMKQSGHEVILTLHDDGQGIKLDQIRKEAIRLNLIKAEDQLNDDQLIPLIFSHGLTTQKKATGTAGRGIGMDVVLNEVTALGGHIETQTDTGKGTTFYIYLPLTLTIAQTLLITTGKNTYAIPAVLIDHIQELNAESLKQAYSNQYIKFNDNSYPFAYLRHLFGENDCTPPAKRHNRILLLQSETQHLAVHVDELIGNSEVIVKNIGPQIAHAPGVEGATVMGNGEIILIINPVKLMQRNLQRGQTSVPPAVTSTSNERREDSKPTIMVVDDSLTVRKVTSRLLEREGYKILVAKDGIGAINLLRETVPNVMLVDLEMPHMNGFELISTVRNNPETKDIPIIIISSRTADKHRKFAEELGVDVFLGKPYHEDELMGHITQFTKHLS